MQVIGNCMLSYFILQTIAGAGHHVYADKSDVFNEHVNTTCELADETEEPEEDHDKLKDKRQCLEKPIIEGPNT